MDASSERGRSAVAALLGNATAAAVLDRVRGRLVALSQNDFAVLGELHDVLSSGNDDLSEGNRAAVVSATRHAFTRLWDDVDEVIRTIGVAIGGDRGD